MPRLKSAGWDESQHPRDHGKFAEKPGAGESTQVDGGDAPEWKKKTDPWHDQFDSPTGDHPALRMVPYGPNRTDDEINEGIRFHDDVGHVVDRWVATAGAHLAPEQQSHYAGQLKKCFAYMPVPMAQTALRAIGDVNFYGSTADVTRAIVKHGGRVAEGKRVGGFFSWNTSDRVGSLHIDGGSDTDDQWGGDDTRGIYAHELGHAVDIHHRHSNHPDWRAAWSEEIDRDDEPLSRYARTEPAEGFAEYVRLMLTQPKWARTEYPKCWAFMVARRLTNVAPA